MITVVLKTGMSSTSQIISSVASQLHPGMEPITTEPANAIEVDGDAFRMDNMNLVVTKDGADVALFAQGTWLFACPSTSYQNMVNPTGLDIAPTPPAEPTPETVPVQEAPVVEEPVVEEPVVTEPAPEENA